MDGVVGDRIASTDDHELHTKCMHKCGTGSCI